MEIMLQKNLLNCLSGVALLLEEGYKLDRPQSPFSPLKDFMTEDVPGKMRHLRRRTLSGEGNNEGFINELLNCLIDKLSNCILSPVSSLLLPVS